MALSNYYSLSLTSIVIHSIIIERQQIFALVLGVKAAASFAPLSDSSRLFLRYAGAEFSRKLRGKL